MRKKYNHAYDFACEVVSRKEDGSDVTPRMLARALRKRIKRIMADNPDEMLQACGRFDTMENGE